MITLSVNQIKNKGIHKGGTKMNMKKFTKRILAIVAAGVMTMGMAMPAMAADQTTTDTTNNAKEAYISKTYNTEVNKPMKFNFTATQVTEGNYIVTDDVTCTIPSIEFTETDLNSNKGTYKKLSDKITFATFPQAGKYEYTVKESATTEPAITNNEHQKLIMSQAEYKMDVYVVENAGTLAIDKIIVNKTKDDNNGSATGKVDIGGDVNGNGFNFVNTYVQEAGTGTDPTNPGTDPDDDYTKYGSLNVSKKIDAQAGDVDSDAEFAFTAKFVFPTGTNAETLKAKAGDATLTLDENNQHTFTLKHGQNMKYTGLPVGTKITVTETGVANYKGSASVVLNGGDATIVTAAKYNDNLEAVKGDKLGQKKNTVDVTNTYNYVPTTGIIMNTLPYVLMVALCAAALFGFVAFKRKKVQK